MVDLDFEDINFDLSSIPVFEGINDAPRQPTSSKAGNGANVIAQLNNLIVQLYDFQSANNDRLYTLARELDKSLRFSTTWYVDSTNGRDDNNGLSPGSAFNTLRKASEVAATYPNPRGFERRIALLDGTHSTCELTGFLPKSPNDFIYIQSVNDNPESATLSGFHPLTFASPGIYRLRGLRVRAPYGNIDNKAAIFVKNAHLQIDNIIFGFPEEVTEIHISAHSYSTVEVLSNYKIQGKIAKHHIYLDSLSFMDFSYNSPQRTIDASQCIQLSDASFVALNRSSYLSCWNTDFLFNTQIIAGKKFFLRGSSTIDTASNKVDLFPGSTSGEIKDSSQYL